MYISFSLLLPINSTILLAICELMFKGKPSNRVTVILNFGLMRFPCSSFISPIASPYFVMLFQRLIYISISCRHTKQIASLVSVIRPSFNSLSGIESPQILQFIRFSFACSISLVNFCNLTFLACEFFQSHSITNGWSYTLFVLILTTSSCVVVLSCPIIQSCDIIHKLRCK